MTRAQHANSAGLLTSTYLDVQQATNTKASYAASGVTPEQLAEVEALGASGNVFERLAASIAPEVRALCAVCALCAARAVFVRRRRGRERRAPSAAALCSS